MSSYHMAGFNVAFGHNLFVKLIREVFEISGDGHSMNDFLYEDEQRKERQDDKELLTKYSLEESHLAPEEVVKAKRVKLARHKKLQRQCKKRNGDKELLTKHYSLVESHLALMR